MWPYTNKNFLEKYFAVKTEHPDAMKLAIPTKYVPYLGVKIASSLDMSLSILLE